MTTESNQCASRGDASSEGAPDGSPEVRGAEPAVDIHEAATLHNAKPAHCADLEDTDGTTPRSPSGDSTIEFLRDSRKPGYGSSLGNFGDYEIQEELGRGGMGVVYRAKQVSLNRPVALKVIKAGMLADDAELRRFQNEAEAVAQLDHPGILAIYEVGETDGLRYFTMKLIDGGNLADRIATLQANPRAAALLMIEIAEAIAHSHTRCILHRDLKPANILIDRQGHPHITDFGLARRFGESSNLTQSGAVLGTPSYMAPEQAAGNVGEIGPPADIFSLGAVLYEILTGAPPFRGGTVMETLVEVIEKEPTRPSQHRAGVSLELEAICLKCLEKRPSDRYPSAAALAEDLHRFLRGEEVAAMRADPWIQIRRWTRREPQLVARLIGLGAVEVLTQINYINSHQRDIRVHIGVSAALAAWMLTSIALQWLGRRDSWRNKATLAWAALDVGFLTLILWQLDAISSSMIVGYPLVVAASGLWFRVRLVWLTTALAEFGYGLILADCWVRGTLGRNDHPNIVMACIAITGFVVARQVKRLLLLSSYYENRIPS